MSVTATEFKSNLGKYLELAARQNIFITRNGSQGNECFINTNVIMDILGKRKPFFQDSYAAFKKAIKAETECLVSVSAATDLFYRLRKSLH